VANAWDHKPLGDGVLLAAGIGAITGGVTGGIGKYGGKILARVLRRGAGVARDAEGAEGAAAKAVRGGGCSFSADTAVATPTGEQAIGTLHVGDHVLAYDPQTGKASAQTVEHVWINHDTDLIDLTLRMVSDSPSHASAEASGKQQDAELAAHGLRAPPADAQTAQQAEVARQGQPDAASGAVQGSNSSRAADETVHTTANHPWLTADRGWVAAGNLRIGEPVRRADGSAATVEGVRRVPGQGTMYDLTVSHIHTFAIGTGQYVVHNTGSGICKVTFGSNKSKFDWDEITSGHSDDATRVGVSKTRFSGLSRRQVQRVVRTAWRSRAKVGGIEEQGPGRFIQRWQGRAFGWHVGGYYNMSTDTVESAFPIHPLHTADGSLRVPYFWPRGFKG